jgi:hypothetical protein
MLTLCELRQPRALDRNVNRSWSMILAPNIANVVGVFTMGGSTPSPTISSVFVMNGKSYRFRQSMKQNKDWRIAPGVKLPLLLRTPIFRNAVGFHFSEQQRQSLQDDQFQTRRD